MVIKKKTDNLRNAKLTDTTNGTYMTSKLQKNFHRKLNKKLSTIFFYYYIH